MKIYRIFKFPALLFMLTFFSCGPETIFLRLKLDTPGHHVATGMRFLDTDKFSHAFREFNRAKELDPDYSPAEIGLGLVHGIRGDFETGLKHMKKAASSAQGIKQKTGVNIGIMRLYIMGREKIDINWLKHAKTEFNSAIATSSNIPGAYYYMGMAYKFSSDIERASRFFLKVIELDKEYSDKAKREYKLIGEKE